MIDPLFISSPVISDLTDTLVARLFESPRRRLGKKLRSEIGRAPDDVEATFRSLIAECDLNAFDTRRASRWWGRGYYMLGLPAAVLATVAGATGLASTAGRVPAAVIALVAAGLTTAVTFLHSDDNQRRTIAMSAAWSALADDARLHSLRYVQASTGLDDPVEKAAVVNEFWDRILILHRRKG